MFQIILNKLKAILTPKKEGLTVSIRVKYPLYTAYTPQGLSDFCCGDYPPNRETQVWVNKDGFVIDAPFVYNYWRNIFLEDFPITVYVLDRDTSLRTEAYDANNERKAFLESRIRKQIKREWE